MEATTDDHQPRGVLKLTFPLGETDHKYGFSKAKLKGDRMYGVTEKWSKTT